MAIPFANVNVEDYDVEDIKTSKTGNRFQDITPQLNLILREVRLFSEIQKRGIHKVIKFSCAISNEQADKLKELEKHFDVKPVIYTSKNDYNYLYINEFVFNNKIKTALFDYELKPIQSEISKLLIDIADHDKYFNIIVGLPKVNISNSDDTYLDVRMKSIIFSGKEYIKKSIIDDIPEDCLL